MKLLFKLSAVASCSLIAVMQTDINQQAPKSLLTAPKLLSNTLPATYAATAAYERTSYTASSILTAEPDNVFIGEQSFDLGDLNLDVVVTFENGTFHFKYTATNISNHPLYWAGSKKNCEVLSHHTTLRSNKPTSKPENNWCKHTQAKRTKENRSQKSLMVSGEQRTVKTSINKEYFSGIKLNSISSLRWWSIIALPSTNASETRHEFGDLYGSWDGRGKFRLQFQAPFWNNNSDIPKSETALANNVKLGKHREIIDGLQIDSELHYESGDVLEIITVTNISGGSLYWPRSIESRGYVGSIDFTLDHDRRLPYTATGGCIIVGRHPSRAEIKVSAEDIDSLLMRPNEVFEYRSRIMFNASNFRDSICMFGRDAIRGISRVRGARHTISKPLNYQPEAFPKPFKWDKKTFKASFDKDKGYSHILCE